MIVRKACQGKINSDAKSCSNKFELFEYYDPIVKKKEIRLRCPDYQCHLHNLDNGNIPYPKISINYYKLFLLKNLFK